MKPQPYLLLLAGTLLLTFSLPTVAQSLARVTNCLGLDQPEGPKWGVHDFALSEDEYIMDSNFALVSASSLPANADQQLLQELQPQLEGWGQAVINRDKAWFDKNLTDEYIHTNPAGEVTDKAHETADMLSPAKHTFLSVKPMPLAYDRIRFYNGTVAVVPAHSQATALTGQGKAVTGQVRSLSTWVKRNGSWQMAAFQATLVEKSFAK